MTATLPLQPGVQATAVLSPDHQYRYVLTRTWDPAQPTALWVMLNPSTADADRDDRTLRKIQQFTRTWGLGGLVVVNLFAYRSPDPISLYGHPDPVGPDNDHHIRKLLEARVARANPPPLAVAGWGTHGIHLGRDLTVARYFTEAGHPLHALHRTRSGAPGHPLYLPAVVTPKPWWPEHTTDRPCWCLGRVPEHHP